MFKIYDGRSQFFQWDLERKLIVEDKTINEVHFCNRTEDYSLKREVYELDGLRVVDVPNVILQANWRIHVYGYDINHTKFEEIFEVVARTRPDDYVYGEEELRSWDELLQKVEQIEREGFTDEQVETAVSNYLEKNPIDMEGYATDEELAQAVAAIDLSGYALKTDIPDTSGLATEEYVDEAVAAIKIPEVDLSNYYNKQEIDDKLDNLDISNADIDLSNYYTKEETYSKAQVDDSIQTVYNTINSLDNDFALKDNTYTKDETDAAIQEVVGSIGIPDTSGLASKEYVDNAIAAIEIPEVDLTDYALKSEIPDTSAFTTEEEVIALIAEYATGGGEVLMASEGVEF